MRVVLDTNVLFAAFAAHGLCESVLAVCLYAHQLVLTEEILAELSRHLGAKLRLPPDRVREITSFLRQHSVTVQPESVPLTACRDRSDLAVLGAALAGQAECLVTGDQDLLILRSLRGIPILSPRAFYEWLR